MRIEARALRMAAVCALAGCSAACATVTRGSSTAWEVKTTPEGARVATSHGMSCEPTPCSIKMPRKSRFTASISKPGYKPASVSVTHRMSGGGGAGMAGNVLVGGLIGAGVDVASGAMLDLTPNPTIVALEREAAGEAVVATAAYAPAPVIAPAPEPAVPVASIAVPQREEATVALAASAPAARAPAPVADVAPRAPAAVAVSTIVAPAAALPTASTALAAAPRTTAYVASPAAARKVAEPSGGVQVRMQRVVTPAGIATIETFEPSSAFEP